MGFKEYLSEGKTKMAVVVRGTGKNVLQKANDAVDILKKNKAKNIKKVQMQKNWTIEFEADTSQLEKIRKEIDKIGASIFDN